VVDPPSEGTLEKVAKALGVLPDHNARVFVGIEGVHDEAFLQELSASLATEVDDVAPLGELVADGTVVFFPVGGSNAARWVSRLQHLGVPEFFIFDRDFEPPEAPHYADVATAINARTDAEAVTTSKRELENYLHPAAIRAVRPEVTLEGIGDFDDVPMRVAQSLHDASDSETPWHDLSEKARSKKESTAKGWLNKDAAARMTRAMLRETDPDDELISWLRRITELTRL
jgi:putative ATP-dependent endonuclease of OLD family